MSVFECAYVFDQFELVRSVTAALHQRLLHMDKELKPRWAE